MDAASLIKTTRTAAGLSQAELARRAGTSQPAVARYETGAVSPSVRTLEHLVHAAGRRLVLGDSPAVCSDLSSARMAKLRHNRPAIESAVRAAGARYLRVFGSVARGEDGPDSDIDLLVEFDVSHSGALRLIQLRRALSEILDEQIDLATPELLAPAVAQQALAEAIPL